jgi:hypothetical protein
MGTHTNRQAATTALAGRAAAIRAALAQASITPKQVTLLGIFFALLGAMALLFAANVFGLLFAAACVAMLWLCGLFDAPAAEQPRNTFTTGAHLLVDALLVLALGHAAALPWLGWVGAALLVSLAYLQRPALARDASALERHARMRQCGLAIFASVCVIAALERIGLRSFWTLPLASALAALALVAAIFVLVRRAPR